MKLPFTKRKLQLVLAVLLCLVLGGWWWSVARKDQEPVYQGKRLSEWTASLQITQLGQTNAALDALLEIGPASIPALRQMLTNEGSSFEHGYAKFWSALPDRLRTKLSPPVSRADRQAAAAWALGEIGPAAGSAVPDLTRAQSSPHEHVRRQAAGAIRWANLGRPETPSVAASPPVEIPRPKLVEQILQTDPADEAALMPLLVKLDSDGRARIYLTTNATLVPHLAPLVAKRLVVPEPYRYVHATELLQGLQPEHPAVMPMIKQAMTEEFLPNRINGTIMYWKVTGDAEPALKLICTNLAEPPSPLSQTFPQWLMRLGPAAKPAVPALLKALWHKDPHTRHMAAKALAKIDPEALERAVGK